MEKHHVENDDVATAQLVVKNLRDVDAVSRYLSKSLEPMLANALNSAFDKWIKTSGWAGSVNYWEEGELWLAPDSWKIPDTEEYYWRLELGADESATWAGEDGDSWYWSARALRQSGGTFGVAFICSYGHLSNLAKWRKWLTENFAAFRRLGFTFENKSARGFHEAYLDANEVCVAIENKNLEDVIYPLTDVFAKVNANLPELNKLLERAKNELRK